jgi:hypothetical protein
MKLRFCNNANIKSFFFFFPVRLGFELRGLVFVEEVLYCVSHSSNLFRFGYFGGAGFDLLSSAFQVARIVGVSHQHLAANIKS